MPSRTHSITIKLSNHEYATLAEAIRKLNESMAKDDQPFKHTPWTMESYVTDVLLLDLDLPCISKR